MRIGVVVCVALASAALGAVAAWPMQDAGARGRENAAAAPAQDAAAQAAAMDKWMKSMTPGPQHTALAAMVGAWNVDVTFVGAPGAPPDRSTGASDFTMLMDGRYLSNHFTGKANGQEFTGLGVTGYNNTTGKYEDVWMDSMGTGMAWSTGTFDAESDAIMYKGEYVDPITEVAVRTRGIMRKVNADEYVFQMYSTPAGGKEYESLTLRYARK